MLAELAPPQFKHVFYAGSGSEGNDTIVRMVRRYWDLMGQPRRDVIISRKNGYHGSTMAGASLGGMSYMHEQGGLPIPGIVHIEQPYWQGLAPRTDRAEFGLMAARWLEDKIREVGPHKVAAFIGEPAGSGRSYSARNLLAGDTAHLRRARHPAGVRRGHLRIGRTGYWSGVSARQPA